jgi:hypothetical protein
VIKTIRVQREADGVAVIPDPLEMSAMIAAGSLIRESVGWRIAQAVAAAERHL